MMRALSDSSSARPSSGGFTLVEVVIALVVFLMVIGSIYGVFSTGRDVYDAGVGNLRLQQATMKLVYDLSLNVRQGRINDVADNGAYVAMFLPVDLDCDGDVLENDTYAIQWGAMDNGGQAHEDWKMRYIFVPSTPGASLSEASEGMDFNGDGDTSDVFTRGSIHVQILDSADSVVENWAISGEMVLSPASPSSDNALFVRLNDDGDADAAGKNLRVNLLVFDRDDKGRVYTKFTRSVASARNRQD